VRAAATNDFARRNIEPGGTIYTDKMSGFAALPSLGYREYHA
jgi:hypothetical protein